MAANNCDGYTLKGHHRDQLGPNQKNSIAHQIAKERVQKKEKKVMDFSIRGLNHPEMQRNFVSPLGDPPHTL